MTIERLMIPPVDQARRRLLTVVAGGAVAAAIPAADARAEPGNAADPIYAAIERHKQAAAVYDAATDVRARFNDINMNDEQRKQLAVLEDAADEAWDPREEAAIDLLNTKPTTLAGIVALCRYVEPLLDDDGELPEVIYCVLGWSRTERRAISEHPYLAV